MATICHTFNSNTAAIPAEITTQILENILLDVCLQPFRDSTILCTTHHPIAFVSQTLRSIYLNLPYLPPTNGRTTMLIKLRISEALEFRDLRTLVAYFENSPG